MIRPIQYLRAVAALMVVWHHARLVFPSVEAILGSSGFGASGVDLFFVISGFIMVATTQGKAITPREFMARRVVRVVPLYWLVTVVVVVCALAQFTFKTQPITLETVAKSLFFVPYDSSLYPGHIWPILVAGWTLNYEMFFYALFSVALWTRWPVSSLLAIIGVLVLGAMLPATGAIKSTYTSPILLEFLSGALIGAGWARGWRLGLGASVGLIALGICFLALCDYTAQLPSQLFGAALIVIGSLNATLGMLKSRPLLLLGDASYSIYLSHAFTLLAVKLVWTHVSHSTSVTTAIAFMGFALIASALGGIIVYGVVEGPVTRWFSAKLKRTAKIGPSTEAMPA